MGAEMQKVRDPGILDARKFLMNQVLAESFGTFLRTFLIYKTTTTQIIFFAKLRHAQALIGYAKLCFDN